MARATHHTTPSTVINLDDHNLHSIDIDQLSQQISKSCIHCTTRHLSLCSQLQGEDMVNFSHLSSNHETKAKHAICSEGDKAHSLYNIKSGIVRLSKMLPDGRRQVTGFLFAGDFFGLACQNNYNYSAEAVTDVSLCRFPREKLIETMEEVPALSKRVMEITRTELQSAQEQFLLLGRKNAREKLCSFFLFLARKLIPTLQPKENKCGYHLSMSRSDIADYLGLTVETVSRQITALQKDKLIHIDKAHMVQLNDLNRIKKISTGEV